MDVGGRLDTVWEYLALKYDSDADGRILREEYVRAVDNFSRLDLDRDGVLTAADFVDGADGLSRQMGELGAMLAVLLYLQDGDDLQRLGVEELESALLAVDRDEDGHIGRAEFESRVADVQPSLGSEGGMFAGMLREADPWRALLSGADEDGDGLLALGELFAFFDRHVDENGVWELMAEGGTVSGPAPGTPAPDFSLQPPEGGQAASLSSFGGKRPVALVFGSYT